MLHVQLLRQIKTRIIDDVYYLTKKIFENNTILYRDLIQKMIQMNM